MRTLLVVSTIFYLRSCAPGGGGPDLCTGATGTFNTQSAHRHPNKRSLRRTDADARPAGDGPAAPASARHRTAAGGGTESTRFGVERAARDGCAANCHGSSQMHTDWRLLKPGSAYQYRSALGCG